MGDIVRSVLVCVRPGAAESMSARERQQEKEIKEEE